MTEPAGNQQLPDPNPIDHQDQQHLPGHDLDDDQQEQQLSDHDSEHQQSDHQSDHGQQPVPPNPDAPVRDFFRDMADTMANSVADAIRATRDYRSVGPEGVTQRYPKANDPSTFNGKNRKALPTWIGENEICFRTSPNRYRDETSKIMFAGSFLDGYAKSWFTDYFKDPAGLPEFMTTWPLFCAELKRNFGLEDELAAYEADLNNLSMSDKDHCVAYTARFRAIKRNLPSWDDRNLRNRYYTRVAPRIRNQFVTSGRVPPAALDDLIRVCEEFDHAYWADVEQPRTTNQGSVTNSSATTTESKKQKSSGKGKKSSSGSGSTPAPKPPQSHQSSNASRPSGNRFSKPFPKTFPTRSTSQSSSSSKPSYTRNLNNDGKLKDAERERRLRDNLCLYCGQPGHISVNCLRRKNPSSGSETRARQANTSQPSGSGSRSSAPAGPSRPSGPTTFVLTNPSEQGNEKAA